MVYYQYAHWSRPRKIEVLMLVFLEKDMFMEERKKRKEKKRKLMRNMALHGHNMYGSLVWDD